MRLRRFNHGDRHGYVRTGNTGAYESFKASMRRANEVTQCYATLGIHDFVLVVQAGSPDEYEAWAESALMANASIRRYDSFVVSSRTKFSTQLNVLSAGTRGTMA